MKTAPRRRIEALLSDEESSIRTMMNYSWKKLDSHLEIVRIQSAMAYKKKNYDGYELMYLLDKLIVEARTRKFDKESLDELKANAKKNIAKLVKTKSLKQLNQLLQKQTKAKEQYIKWCYQNLVDYVSEEIRQVMEALKIEPKT